MSILALIKLLLIDKITKITVNYLIISLDSSNKIAYAFLNLCRLSLTVGQQILLLIVHKIHDGDFEDMIDNFYDKLFIYIIGKYTFVNYILFDIVMSIIFLLPDILDILDVFTNNIMEIISDTSNLANIEEILDFSDISGISKMLDISNKDFEKFLQVGFDKLKEINYFKDLKVLFIYIF